MPASIGDVKNSLLNAVQAINALTVALQATYTQISNTTATSASAGSGSSLPATPQFYANVTINGVAGKIAVYKP